MLNAPATAATAHTPSAARELSIVTDQLDVLLLDVPRV